MLHCLIVPLLTLGTWGCLPTAAEWQGMAGVGKPPTPAQQQRAYDEEKTRNDAELEALIEDARKRDRS